MFTPTFQSLAAGIAVVTFIALVLVVSGQEWAVGIAGAGIFMLVILGVLFGRRR